MSGSTELSYYEYWLSKDIWTASRAIQFIAAFYCMHRSWKKHENSSDVYYGFFNEISNRLCDENAKYIFTKRSIMTGYDENNIYVENKLDVNQSDVVPRDFLMWLNDNCYDMPYEFKIFIGKQDDDGLMNKKLEDRISKEVVQGIGKTLWDIYPTMTIEDMLGHKSIRIYGGGKSYERDTTVRRWLSEIDPREIKTGPKKKI
jgi:hypothetical protein